MALSTEINFKSTVTNVSGPSNAFSSKSFSMESYSSFLGTDLSWDPNLTSGLIKVTSPLGITYNNTVTSSPDITSVSVGFLGTDINLSTNTVTNTTLPSNIKTGDPIVITVGGTGTIFAIPNKTLVYAIVVSSTSFQLASTVANALSGVPLSLSYTSNPSCKAVSIIGSAPMPVNSDGEILQGNYDVEVTLFSTSATTVQSSRVSKFSYNYYSPKVKLSSSYSLFNPAYLTSIDETNYTKNSSFSANTNPLSSSIVFTLNYPQGLGTYTTNYSTLTTSSFYAGSPAIHGLVFNNEISYYFSGGTYGDGAVQTLALYIDDYVSCEDHINVYKDSSSCDLYCCLKEANSRMVAAEGTGAYPGLRNDYILAEGVASMITLAFNCGKSVDIAKLMDQFQKLTNCNGDCGCDAPDPVAVIAIGTLPGVVRKEDYAFSIASNSYQSNNLIGLSWDNGDFLLTVSGKDVSSDLTNSATFNTLTGTVTFTTTQAIGTTLSWYRLKV